MMRILQVNTSEYGGGAATVAWNLHHVYQSKGHLSWFVAGHPSTEAPGVLPLSGVRAATGWAPRLNRLGETLVGVNAPASGTTLLRRTLRILAEPRHALDWWRGVEDFNFPETMRILDLASERPDIVHCHNLHGDYFDLRALPRISQQIPLVLTLHDAWLLSGHCAYSFGCERWKTGCGHCPDLTIYPAVRRDATASNWRRKQEIVSRSRLFVATPSRWLMQMVEQSLLSGGIADARVIPNGVDRSIFHPIDKAEARSQLGLPLNARMLLFTAKGIRSNIWKDYSMMRTAVADLASRIPREKILFVALGEASPPEHVGGAEIRFAPYEPSPHQVARFYQAADVYVHAARADNFPLTVLEAQACGVPVVATNVGGIPEQIDDGRTGFLVPPGNPRAMADAIETLLSDEGMWRKLSAQAEMNVAEHFDLTLQAETYLGWYQTISERFTRG